MKIIIVEIQEAKEKHRHTLWEKFRILNVEAGGQYSTYSTVMGLFQKENVVLYDV
jgi:hypothetical protein